MRWKQIACVLTCLLTCSAALDVNWCVTSVQEERYCNDMSGDLTANYGIDLNVKCVYEFNKFACMRIVKERTNEMWLIGLDPEDAYVAARYHGMQPLVEEVYQQGARDFAVAVIRNPDRGGPINKISDLQGKKSCHPDLDYTVGWNIPYGRLINSIVGLSIVDCDAALNNTAQIFSQSCAPGTWAMDIELKNSLPTLCELCKDNNCGRGGSYAQLQGAVQCLKTSGDVAFTTYSAAKKEIQSTELTNYALLCTKVTSTNKHWALFSDFATCNWAEIPGHLIMTRGSIANQQKEELASLLKLIYTVMPTGARPSWFDNFFLSDAPTDEDNRITGLRAMLQGERDNYKLWLDEGFRMGMNLDEIPNPGQCGGLGQQIEVGMCIISEPELDKCEELRDAMMSKRIRPLMKCVLANDYRSCIDQVGKGGADLVNLNAGHIYTAGTSPEFSTKLIPIAGERFQDDPRNGYYAVVVAKSETVRKHNLNIFRMRGKGFNSCHAFEWDGASWVVAAQRLMDLSQVGVYNCDVTWGFRTFFYGGSCVPGIDREQTQMCKWCSQGTTSTAQRCKISQEEPFFNHVGAFRCLAEDAGDIGFTRHLVPSQNTNHRNEDEWARDLSSGDFQILCADGSVRDIDSGSQCNLNFVPSNHIMVSSKISSTKRTQLWRMLDTMQRFFGSQKFMQENEGTWSTAKFHMFESKWLTLDNQLETTRNFTDLIFTDTVYKLEPVPWNNTYFDVVTTSTGASNFEVMCRQSDYNKPNCYRRSSAPASHVVLPPLLALTSTLILLIHKYLQHL